MTKKWVRARKKPIVVHVRDVIPNLKTGDGSPVEVIKTREGQLHGYPGKDYIIRGVKGERYPIKIDIFRETYDLIDTFQVSGEKTQ